MSYGFFIPDHAKDFKPGPYPKTEDERIAAAKKYNLLPEEYEPYPDDGNGLGDYPKIDALSGEARNPYYPWSIPAMARDFNEAVSRLGIFLGGVQLKRNINLKLIIFQIL